MPWNKVEPARSNLTASHGQSQFDSIPPGGDIEQGLLGESSTGTNGESNDGFPKPADYKDWDNFVEVQKKRREENLKNSGNSKTIFLSHCHRSKDTALHVRKRMCIDMISREGIPYWADFLDLPPNLQGGGPVHFRKEIVVEIRKCGRLVLFVDEQYLKSHNCLQEVVFALEFKKPMVVVILDEGAADLLRNPTKGAAEAWQSPGFFEYEGENLSEAELWDNTSSKVTKDHYLNLELVVDLFKKLADINYCSCRSSDFGMRMDGVTNKNDDKRAKEKQEDALTKMILFVDRDLKYLKAHAALMVRAMDWAAQGHSKTLLLQGGDARQKNDWLLDAKKEILQKERKVGRLKDARNEFLPLEELVVNFVETSFQNMRTNKLLRRIGYGIFVVMLAVLTVYCVISRQDAVAQSQRADANAEEAWKKTVLAEEQTQRAEEQKRLADQRAEEARLQTAIAKEERAVSYVSFLAGAVNTDPHRNGYPHALLLDGQSFVQELPAAGEAALFEAASRLVDGPQAAAKGVAYPLHVLEGHTAGVNSLAWSPDGTRLVSASADRSLRVWSAEGGDALHVLEGHTGSVSSVAWSPDSTRLASASSDGSVRVWSAEGGEALHVLEGHAGALEGRTCSAPFSVNASGAVNRGVSSVAWSPDGTRLTSTRWDDCSFAVWSAEGGEAPLHVLEGHTAGVTSAAWSPDGVRIASVSGDGSVRVWSADVGGEALHVLSGHASAAFSVVWSPDGTHLASGSGDNSVRVWSADGGEALHVLEGHVAGVSSVTWSMDGMHLASASADHSVRVWSAAEGGKALHVLEGHVAGVRSVGWSADGTHLASGSDEGSVRIWSVEGGKVLRVLGNLSAQVHSMAWSPDGTRLASGSRSDEGSVIVWSAEGGEALHVLEGHTYAVHAVEWSPDSTRLASASSDGSVRVWSAEGGEALHVFEGHQDVVYSVVWSPDGTRLASASEDYSVRVWSAEGGEALHVLDGHVYGVNAVAWSPDGTRLASASADRTVRVWSAEEGGVALRVLEGHDAGVHSVAWSPDSTRLASASDGSSMLVWSVEGGEVLHVLESPTDYVSTVAWLPENVIITIESTSGGMHRWSEDLCTWQRASIAHFDVISQGDTVWCMSTAFVQQGSKAVVVASSVTYNPGSIDDNFEYNTQLQFVNVEWKNLNDTLTRYSSIITREEAFSHYNMPALDSSATSSGGACSPPPPGGQQG